MASPSGASATSPLASIGQNDTPALIGRIDSGVKLGLIVYAIQPQSPREVDKRLLLVEQAEHVRCGLKCSELAISIEDVELAVVLPECRSGVGAACVIDLFRRILSLADDHRFKDAEQPVAIRCEVLQDVDGARVVAHDRDQVHGRHLRANEFLGRL